VTNGTGDTLEKITNGAFNIPPGLFVDVGYIIVGGTAGTLTSGVGGIAPSTVDDSINATVGFNFPGSSGLPAGATTLILVTETLANNFAPGLIGIIDSSTATVAGFEPASSVTPLPATLPLFATGLGALGLLGWRRKRKAAAIAA